MKQKTIETLVKVALDDWAQVRAIATREQRSVKDVAGDVLHRGLKNPKCL